MTAFVRKPAEQPVLREDWHENEDGSRLLLLKYPLLERRGSWSIVLQHGSEVSAQTFFLR